MGIVSTDRVLIVGAGPTGLTAAAFLAQQGIDVDLIDTRSEPVRDSRALGVHARTLEFMSMLGLDDVFIEQGHKTRYMTFHRGARELFKLDFDVISKKTRYPYMLVLPQAKSERILVSRLLDLGLSILWQTKLTSFEEVSTGVLATLALPDGRISERHYAYVIGCDGASSLVRQSLDIPFEGETYPLRFLLSEVEISGNSVDRTSSHVFMGEETTVAVIPQPDDVYRIVGPDFSSVDEDTNKRGATRVEFDDFAMFLKRNSLLQHVEMKRPSRLVSYRIQKRVAAQYRKGRVFIAGDAAHIHSPAGGQGMNTGLNDVANLSWKLATVIKGKAPSKLLESYEVERRAAAISVVTNADAAMMRVVSRKLSARLFFDHVVPVVTRFYQPRGLMEAMAQIAWSYPPTSGATAFSYSGHRMPDLPLTKGGYSNDKLGRGDLIAFASGRGTWIDKWQRATKRKAHRLARPFRSPNSSPFEGIILCRADGYVAAAMQAKLFSGSERPLPSLGQLLG